MSDELIKLPIKLDDWEVFFDSRSQAFSLKQNNPTKIDFDQLNLESGVPTVFTIEVCPDVVLEASLIKDIGAWLTNNG